MCLPHQSGFALKKRTIVVLPAKFDMKKLPIFEFWLRLHIAVFEIRDKTYYLYLEQVLK